MTAPKAAHTMAADYRAERDEMEAECIALRAEVERLREKCREQWDVTVMAQAENEKLKAALHALTQGADCRQDRLFCTAPIQAWKQARAALGGE